jgi:hypothetical protein
MRPVLTCAVLLLVPSLSFAQTEEMIEDVQARLESLKFVASLHDPESGAFKATPTGKPSLRATSTAARAWKYLGGENLGSKFPEKAKAAAFVMSCYDPKTGGFADAPGGKPDVMVTAVGVMAAVEFEIPKEKFAKAMDYLKENAKTFEEVRLGAAAVEAWGVKDCPFDLKSWFKIADEFGMRKGLPPINGGARDTGSLVAMWLRLGREPQSRKGVLIILNDGQWATGGWAKAGEKEPDAETTYRVMRAFMLLKENPKDPAKVREFLAKCRNADGGYGTKPGEASTLGGVYFAAIITRWLNDLEKK